MILVTGGAGYIGSHTCLQLLQTGHDLVVLDNLSNSQPEALRRVQKLAGRQLQLVEGDIRDQTMLDAVFRYPVKALLVVTITVAVLALLAVERLLLEEALPRWRSRAGLVLLVLAGLVGFAAVVSRVRPGVPRGLLLSLWDPAWASDPGVVLAPVLERLPRQAASSAALLLVAGLLLARGRGGADS